MAADPTSTFDVTVDGHGTTTARVYAGARDASLPCVILAHGAGAGQQHPFMVQTASGLAGRGTDVVTFDFLYMASRRRTPDRAPLLEATWRAVVAEVRSRVARGRFLVVGGKSMGGRIASQVLASPPPISDVAGLVLLGYPLHPPGRPEKLRIAHLPALGTPTLVVQGTRDEFGGEDEIRAAFAVVPARVDWHIVAGGDHSFKVPRASGPQAEVLCGIHDAVAAWIQRLTPRALGPSSPRALQ